MATPARLVRMACPACRETHWEIDNDYRGSDLFGAGRELGYPERHYLCPSCGRDDIGWEILEKSPAEFFLQPHSMYPMRQREFDHWCAVLRQQLPDHPLIAEIGREFRPNTHILRTRFQNLMLNRRYYLGRLRYVDYAGLDTGTGIV